MDDLGDKYWPIFGAVYFVVAVKRVRGMRMITPIKKLKIVTGNAPVSVASRALNARAKNKNNL
jgi:hypothetical protein